MPRAILMTELEDGALLSCGTPAKGESCYSWAGGLPLPEILSPQALVGDVSRLPGGSHTRGSPYLERCQIC